MIKLNKPKFWDKKNISFFSVLLIPITLLTLLIIIFIMNNFDFATATRLDLEIWDTQNKIKYIKLPTRKARKSECWFTQTKGVRTNTNRGRINTKSANLV